MSTVEGDLGADDHEVNVITNTTTWLQWQQYDYNDNNIITTSATIWSQWQHLLRLHRHLSVHLNRRELEGNGQTSSSCRVAVVMIMIMMMVVVIVNSEYQAQKCHHHDSCLTCVMLVSRRPAKWGGLLWLPHLRIDKCGACVTRKTFFWALYKKKTFKILLCYDSHDVSYEYWYSIITLSQQRGRVWKVSWMNFVVFLQPRTKRF